VLRRFGRSQREAGADVAEADDAVEEAEAEEAEPAEVEADGVEADEVEADEVASAPVAVAPASRRRVAAQPVDDDPDLKPTAMRGPELRYGYIVAAVLAVVGVLNLLITHGKGAPKHPPTGASIGGLLAVAAFVGLLQLRHRLVAPFAAIIAAFFVTTPKVPDALATTGHILALLLPVAYAVWITQRHRKSQRARQGSPLRMTPAERRAAAEARRGNRRSGRTSGSTTARAPASGPRASPRYTPPKAKRARR
jgi:hypothetical protein